MHFSSVIKSAYFQSHFRQLPTPNFSCFFFIKFAIKVECDLESLYSTSINEFSVFLLFVVVVVLYADRLLNDFYNVIIDRRLEFNYHTFVE